MVTANIGRTAGDIGKYIQMDFAHGLAGAAAIVGGGLVAGENFIDLQPGDEYGTKNYLAAGVAIAVGALLFGVAGGASEGRGDYIAAGSLGAFAGALFWATDYTLKVPEDSGGSESSSIIPRGTRLSGNRRREDREMNSWGSKRTANSPRSRRRERKSWA